MQEPATHREGGAPQGVRVINTESVKEPKKDAAEMVNLHEGDHMVTRVMRLAPGATIKEHYHPVYDETFFVHAGTLKLIFDSQRLHLLDWAGLNPSI